ncbi:acyclic terpene utilization AtuA family protein [Actinoallomurus sp. NPDC050550]|uniref:acyclic terpene utilization AtuA family protein n=1 Tax=Actinoallomurus sp. NPDC050550 TaxID=3154937 RepID=UPI00340FF9A0
MRTVRVGCGAGFAGDRVQPAVDLVDRGELDYLVLECLAERTTALGQLRRLADPTAGYGPSVERRMRLLLKPLARTGTRLVTNIGSADPLAAARRVLRIAAELAVPVSVAAVTGDDILDRIDVTAPAWEDGRPLIEHGELVSASAYLGADALLPALRSGAQVVIGGRIADPSLFVAPLAHEFGWSLDDVDRIAGATAIGHLLECGGQVTGGYFADPPYKTVPDLANLGYPIAIAPTREAAEAIGHEVTALYTTGPAGGGGVRVTTEEVIGIVSTSIERSLVEPCVHHPVADR